MPNLDVGTLKAFMHPALLDSFQMENGLENPTLTAAVTVAIQAYNALTRELPAGAVNRLDATTFQIKTAFTHIYVFILHDVSYLTAVTLTGLGLNDNQIYEHFKRLLQAERDELKDMRDELLDEIDEYKGRYGGVKLHHQNPRRRRGGRR